jgi:fructokinase
MIAVVGEALIDLIISPSGNVRASPGGGPFNVARTIGRLGNQSAFIGRLSADGFGRTLRAVLDRDNVRLAVPDVVEVPSTLAAVDVDAAGVPRFRFYLAGTSAAAVDEKTLAGALPGDLAALHVGSLGLVMEPIGDSVSAVLNDVVAPDVLVMADPNCRPDAITAPEDYRARLGRVLRRANVVKVSTEDLAYLRSTPHALLDSGPSLVLVTDGPRPARALTRDADIEVPVPASQVVDTIGAGDAFGGAFLAWWIGHGLGVAELGDATPIRRALEAAVEVAAITCTRPGANPPWASELADWQAGAT